MAKQEKSDQEGNLIRPDPMFKELITKAALVSEIEMLNVELPQLLRADMLLAVPEGKDLSGTPFDFLLPYSILEFKSTNDDFDRFEFAKNLARTFLFFSQYKKIPYNKLLTVFVCSEQPDSVLDHLKAEGITIEIDPATPWLLRCRIWTLAVAIVVCRLLPLEERFYDWLQFAPATSVKWREFVTLMLLKGNRNQLEVVKKLNLREYRIMLPGIMEQFVEQFKELNPEGQAAYRREWVELLKVEFNMVKKLSSSSDRDLVELLKAEFNMVKELSSSSDRDLVELLKAEFNDLEEQNPEIAKELFSGVKPELRLAGLAPEERLAGLAPEERLAGLASEERLAGLTPEQRLEGLTPEQVMAKFTPEQLQKYLDLLNQRNNPPNGENQTQN